MMRTIVISAFALLVLPYGAAMAEKTYKWIDSEGRVSYHDRPPPANSGFRVEEKQVGTRQSGRSSDSAAETVSKVPVVLYSIPKCTTCDLARLHLQKRRVAFTEKNLEKDSKAQDELMQKAGSLPVPTVLVGSKVITGYSEGWLDSELDQVGYPKVESGVSEEEKTEEGFRAPVQ